MFKVLYFSFIVLQINILFCTVCLQSLRWLRWINDRLTLWFAWCRLLQYTDNSQSAKQSSYRHVFSQSSHMTNNSTFSSFLFQTHTKNLKLCFQIFILEISSKKFDKISRLYSCTQLLHSATKWQQALILKCFNGWIVSAETETLPN